MVNVRNESDIDAEAATYLRRVRLLTQAEFWLPIGVSQPRGHRYEIGSNKMPECVRKLLFVRYVAGLDLDDPKQEGFRELKRLRRTEREKKLDKGAKE